MNGINIEINKILPVTSSLTSNVSSVIGEATTFKYVKT